jgi:hypothetical protein
MTYIGMTTIVADGVMAIGMTMTVAPRGVMTAGAT